MTQYLVSLKFVQYLQLTNPTEAKKIENNIGLCFGLSICHAAMKQFGKLKWWEAALREIVHWDGDPKKLNKKVHLPNTEQSETLKTLFENVIDTVIYYQEGAEHPVNEKLFAYQKKMLMPGKKKFDRLISDKKSIIIKSSDRMVGFFELAELLQIINQNEIKKSICIVANSEHAIAVEYQHPDWIVYDPDYDHNIPSTQTIHKRFHSKKELIKEINTILGDIIVINLALFDNVKHSEMLRVYEQLIHSNPDIIICALPVVVAEAPQYISPALEEGLRCYKNGTVEKLLANILVTIYQPNENWNGLHNIARYAPDHLMRVLKLASHTRQGKEQVALALQEKNEDGVTGLRMIEQYAPHCVNHAIKILQSIKSKKEVKLISAHSFFKNKHEIFLSTHENKNSSRYLR